MCIADDGKEKIANFHQFSPDLVITDIIMPNMDGWTFAREYRKFNLHPNAKFVVLSNQNQQEDLNISKLATS
jgi:CheY-like chemotaxis protein